LRPLRPSPSTTSHTLCGIARPAHPAQSPRSPEEALRESRERLRAIVDTAADAIITIDRRGVIESVNLAAEKMFGYTTAEMVGQNVTLLMSSP
jgi:PAS domain-containing protein